jgi:hypothetical protein
MIARTALSVMRSVTAEKARKSPAISGDRGEIASCGYVTIIAIQIFHFLEL